MVRGSGRRPLSRSVFALGAFHTLVAVHRSPSGPRSSGGEQLAPRLVVPGTGKSHLAIALGIAACMQSRRVRFTTTAGLVNELLEARDDKSLSKVVARYSRIELLILDELAYVPLGPAEAELLFQVLDERSELSALIVTTNLPSSGSGPRCFPNRVCKAVVDRLTFNSHIIETGTESWR